MSTKKLVLMAMLVAIAVAGSAFVSFPAGVARAYPVQHAINVMAGVLFGPGPAGEIIGTGVIASLIAVPYAAILMGTEAGFFYFMPAFLASSISGAVIGVVTSKKMKNAAFSLQN